MSPLFLFVLTGLWGLVLPRCNMPFPTAPRVVYSVNPLDEVICQLRFPPILKIDTESPARFQEFIRADYPNYELKASVKLPPGIPADLAQSIAADLPLGGHKSHVFGSRDSVWHLNLTRHAMSLNCGEYERWENFKVRLAGAFDALVLSYTPAYFTRIGLRYCDVIRRSRLGLQDVAWGVLLKPWLSGVLGTSGVEYETYGTETICGINLSDGLGRVQLRYGLAIEETPGDNKREEVFFIDSDFFIDQETESSNVINRLDAFHEQAGRLFRWCITDRLHDALRPGPVPPL